MSIIKKVSDETLIKHTLAYMIRESLDLLNLNQSYYLKNSCWQTIVKSVYGVEDNKESLYIYRLWERDTRQFKSKVLNTLNKIKTDKVDKPDIKIDTSFKNEKKENIKKINLINKELFTCYIKYEEWKSLLNNLTNINKRPRFKKIIDNILSDKIQKIGINCQLKSSFNNFNKSKRQKCHHWRGKFSCVFCKQVFIAFIENEPLLSKNLNFNFENY